MGRGEALDGPGGGQASQVPSSAGIRAMQEARDADYAWDPAEARVAIVGVGLIGGSLARDLAALGAHVMGFDADAETLGAAMDAGAVHEALPAGPAREAGGGITGAGVDLHALASASLDALVLAVPVEVAVPLLAAAAPHLGDVPLVTDVGSTKASIVDAASGLGLGERFVGSHPLAGSHLSGWGASRPGLFRGNRVYLCPSAEGGHEAGEEPGRGALRRAHALWTSVGAVPQILDSVSHDRLLAWTSHLPQATSTALARALAGAGVGVGDLGPGGSDMTRLAASSPSLWTGIALDNAEALSAGLAALERELAELRASLRARDRDAVQEFFAGGSGGRPGEG
jgi:prephenate dehydrogenase